MTVIIKIKSMFIFLDFKFFSLTLLGISLHIKVLFTFHSSCLICYFTCIFTLYLTILMHDIYFRQEKILMCRMVLY